MLRDTVNFACPACGHAHLLDVVPASRTDPGYLDGDPPEECEDCGADMEGAESEPADPDDFRDPDREAEIRGGW